jgi:hypothetical protein
MLLHKEMVFMETKLLISMLFGAENFRTFTHFR